MIASKTFRTNDPIQFEFYLKNTTIVFASKIYFYLFENIGLFKNGGVERYQIEYLKNVNLLVKVYKK